MYDPGLAARLDDIISGMLEMEVTRMFGGYGFLMNGHMCLGVWDDRLVIRIERMDRTPYATSPTSDRWTLPEK